MLKVFMFIIVKKLARPREVLPAEPSDARQHIVDSRLNPDLEGLVHRGSASVTDVNIRLVGPLDAWRSSTIVLSGTTTTLNRQEVANV